MGFFNPKQKMYELKIYRVVIYVLKMKKDVKFEEALTCRLKIDMRNLADFDQSTRKSQEF